MVETRKGRNETLVSTRPMSIPSLVVALVVVVLWLVSNCVPKSQKVKKVFKFDAAVLLLVWPLSAVGILNLGKA